MSFYLSSNYYVALIWMSAFSFLIDSPKVNNFGLQLSLFTCQQIICFKNAQMLKQV